MKNKNIVFLLITGIICLSLLTVASAECIDDNITSDDKMIAHTDVISFDKNTDEELSINDNTQKNIQKEKTVKKDTQIAVSTSSQLATSGNYYLTNDITLTSFELTGSFSLDGKGHTVTLTDKVKAKDFNGNIHISNTIFTGNGKMKLECGDVIIKNCTFKNFQSDCLEVSDDAKNPVRSNNEKVIITNCSFLNNYGDSLKIKECEATVDKCNFIDCGVYDGVIISKRASVIVDNTNISSCQSPAFFIEKGGSIYIHNVLIDGVNQTNKHNTSNQYQVKIKDNQTAQIILPNEESQSKINITANNTIVNTENNIHILLSDESSNAIKNALITITIKDTNNKTAQIQKTTDDEGIVNITQISQFTGIVTVNVSYAGESGKYLSANNSITYTVDKKTDKEILAVIIESINTTMVNIPINITVYLTDINSNKLMPENLTVYINNTKITPTITDKILQVTYTPKKEQNLNVTAVFGGNNYYANASASKIIKVTSTNISKKKTEIIMIDDMDGIVDGFFKTTTPNLLPIKFKVMDENSSEVNEGTVTIVESYKTIGTIDLSTGMRIYNYDTLSHPFGASIAKRLKINYEAADNYYDSNNTFIIGIVRAKTTQKTNLTVNATNTTVNRNNTIIITLKTNDDGAVSYETVNVNIDGVSDSYTTDANGQVIITNYTSKTVKENIPVIVNYAGSHNKDLFAALEQSTSFNVLKNPNIKETKISIVDTRDDAEDNIIRAETNDTILFEVNITDNNDNQVKEGIVTFKYVNDILGTIDLSKTNITYYNPLQINIPAVTARKIKIEYSGTDNYDPSNNTFTLSIKRTTPLMKVSINATNTTVGQKNTITAVLTADGNPVSGEKIILNIDGVDYECITDLDGQVTYNNYYPNEVKYVKVIAIYDGNYDLKYMAAKNNTTTFYVDNISKNNKTTTIELIDTHDDLNNGKIVINNEKLGLIEFNVYDDENSPVNKGLMTLRDMNNNVVDVINLSTSNRTFVLNSLAVNFSASKAGYFKFNYTGVDEYLDSNMKFMLSYIRQNYIQTNLKVTATDTTVNQRNIITVNLTSNDGRAIYGEKVALKITDKTYYVTTDENGIGQYKIFTYPMAKTLSVNAQYEGNTTKYYLESSNNTTFTVKKADILSTDKSTSTLYMDKHDGLDDYLLDIFTDKINKIEYIVVDVNGNKINEGTVTLYVNGLNKTDSINMSTNNSTFLFNPLKYDYTDNLQTTFTVYYTGVNGYENSLATIKTTIHKNENIPVTIEVSATNTTLNNPNKIKITLKANDILLDNENITVTIDDKEYNYTTDSNAQVIINYSSKIAKNNIPLKVYYAGDNSKGLKTAQNQTTFNIIDSKQKTNIEYKVINITASNTTFNLTLKDNAGKVISNADLTLEFNNSTKTSINTKNKIILNLPVGKNTFNVIYPGNNNYYASNKTITVTVPKHNTTITADKNSKYYVGVNTLNAQLLDENKNNVSSAVITIDYDGNTTTVKTDKNGKFGFNPVLKEGQNNITLKYSGNNTYETSNITLKLTAVKSSVKVISQDITGIVGENITLTVKLVDESGNPVINGKLIFKSKGLTLKEDGVFGSSAQPKVLTVANGVVAVNITANTQLRRAGQISISYAGSNKYNSNQTESVNVKLERRNASIKVECNEITNQDTKLLIKAYVYDITGKNKMAVQNYEDNFVVFKVNGITIKDADGKAIQVKVVNGLAQINYTVPIGLAGKYTNLTDRVYTVLALFGSSEYNMDVKNTTTFKVNRSEVFFNNVKVTYNSVSKKINVISKLQDYHKNMLKGQNTIVVKVNGLSYKENNKLKVFLVTNGLINITLNADGVKNIKNIMLVTGQRVGYLGTRQTISDIIRI